MLTPQMYEAPPKKACRVRRDRSGSALSTAANPDSISSHSAAQAGSWSSLDSSAAPSRPAELRLGHSALINQDGTDGATIALTTPSVASQPAAQFSDGPQNGNFVAVWIKVNAVDGLTSGFNINPSSRWPPGRSDLEPGR